MLRSTTFIFCLIRFCRGFVLIGLTFSEELVSKPLFRFEGVVWIPPDSEIVCEEKYPNFRVAAKVCRF
jgi:hypothetical protein